MNIGVYCPTPNDTTSLYRGYGPFGHIARLHPTAQIHYLNRDSMSWPIYQSLDILFMQRPASVEHLRWIQNAKDVGCWVVIDYDDLFFDIPNDNKAYLDFMNPEIQGALSKIIVEADLIFVSTDGLKKEINSRCNTECVVINNAVDPRWFPANPLKENKQISWRGGDSHLNDTVSIAKPLLDVIHNRTEWDLRFYGWNPFPITSNLDPSRYSIFRTRNQFDYHHNIQETGGAIGIVPLVKNAFNICKSNIGWIELTLSGHCVLAADLPEFKQIGCVNYSDAKDFKEKLEELIKDKRKRQIMFNESLSAVYEKYTLDHTNVIRMNKLEGLMS